MAKSVKKTGTTSRRKRADVGEREIEEAEREQTIAVPRSAPTNVAAEASKLVSSTTLDWMTHVENVLKRTSGYKIDLSVRDLTVKYPTEITQHRTIEKLTGGEEVVRAFLIYRLLNILKYSPAALAIERPYPVGRSSRNTQSDKRIDVLLNKVDSAFYFIEAKSPERYEADKGEIKTQLFALAGVHRTQTGSAPDFLVYYTIEFVGGEPRDKCIIIDHKSFQTYEEWIKADRPSVANELSPDFDRPRKVAFVKGGKNGRELASDFSARDLDAMATNLHNVLWGGGSVGDTDVFNSLVNLILAKIQDEEDRKDGEEYHFQIKTSDEGPDFHKTIFERVNRLYHVALKAKLGRTDKTEPPDVVQPTKFHPSKLVYTVQTLEGLSLTGGRENIAGKDIIGGFFERIQRDGFAQSKGQFFTPSTIVRFMLYALNLDRLAIDFLNDKKRLPYVIDPSCGSATFLIEAMQMVTRELAGRQADQISTSKNVMKQYNRAFGVADHEHSWARECLYGIEHNFDLATASKVNMILHGDGSANVFHGDGLKSFESYHRSAEDCPDNILQVSRRHVIYDRPMNEKFDVVVSNPPFSVDLDDDTKRGLEEGFLFSDKRKSENLFLERYWQLLTPGGRIGVVLPENVFDTGENRYIRLFLFKHFTINAVVSLPALTFQPYTQTKTSILFATKKQHVEVEMWSESWRVQSSEYRRLLNKVKNYMKVYIDGHEWEKLPSVKDDDQRAIRRNLETFIERQLTPDERELEDADLLRRLQPEIERASALDDDVPGATVRINSEWVFRRIAPEVSYTFAVHEAQSVGYKRSRVKERSRPNDLFDLEVAPSKIDRGAVRKVFDTEKELLTKSLLDLQRRLERLELRSKIPETRSKSETVKVREDTDADALESSIAARRKELETLASELTQLEAALIQFYSFDGESSEGSLKREFADRVDEELLSLFRKFRLVPFSSSAIALRMTERRTILDHLRQDKIWK